MDLLSPLISVLLCHSDRLFHGESCPSLDVVRPGRSRSSSPACTWRCSLHYLMHTVFALMPRWRARNAARPTDRPLTNAPRSPLRPQLGRSDERAPAGRLPSRANCKPLLLLTCCWREALGPAQKRLVTSGDRRMSAVVDGTSAACSAA